MSVVMLVQYRALHITLSSVLNGRAKKSAEADFLGRGVYCGISLQPQCLQIFASRRINSGAVRAFDMCSGRRAYRFRRSGLPLAAHIRATSQWRCFDHDEEQVQQPDPGAAGVLSAVREPCRK